MRRRAAKIIVAFVVVGCVSEETPDRFLLAAIDTRAARITRLDQEGEGAAPSDSKTFTSADWGVALDYPPGWTVDNDGDEVTFRSANGTTIVLGRTATDTPSEPAPGRRTPTPECTTTTTAHGVAATVCVDAASSARRAVLVLKTREGRQFRLALRTRGHESQIFDAMLASVRRYP